MLILECSKGCYRVKIRPRDLDLWPMTLLIFKVKGQGHRVKFLGEGIRHALRCPCCVDCITRQNISLCHQCLLSSIYAPQKLDPVTLIFDLWPWQSIGFRTLVRTKYVPSLVKIHWRMLILKCSQGCYRVKIKPYDLWPLIIPSPMKLRRDIVTLPSVCPSVTSL
jgi:hypothetical protein